MCSWESVLGSLRCCYVQLALICAPCTQFSHSRVSRYSYLILCSWSVAAAHRGSPVLLCPGDTRSDAIALSWLSHVTIYIIVLAHMSLYRASPHWLPAHTNSHTSCVKAAVILHSCVFIHNWSSSAVVTRSVSIHVLLCVVVHACTAVCSCCYMISVHSCTAVCSWSFMCWCM